MNLAVAALVTPKVKKKGDVLQRVRRLEFSTSRNVAHFVSKKSFLEYINDRGGFYDCRHSIHRSTDEEDVMRIL
jgi:hypothetical protein